MGQKVADKKRICENLDKGTFLNRNLDGALPNQDEVREELHKEYERKGTCHIYKGEKHCYCDDKKGEKCVVWDWGKDVVEQIAVAAKREKDRGYGFTFDLLQGTEAGREWLENIEEWLKNTEEKIKEEKKKR